MDWSLVIYPAAVVGGLGLVFGMLLAVASRVFSVKKDAREEELREALPGANCGACGYAGCDAYASAVASGSAEVGTCPVGGSKLAAQMASIMGVDASAMERKIAVVACQGTTERVRRKMIYEGLSDCTASNLASEGEKACRFGCMGLGTCVRTCPFDAISIRDGVAWVDPDKCMSCERCVKACPKNIIFMVPERQKVKALCRSQERAKSVREKCDAGCIGCGICVKNCEAGAIALVNNFATIDPDKCTGCMVCVEKCPTKAIKA